MPAAGQQHSAQTTDPKRRRALIVPREHGAWGILLIPLFTGAAVGLLRVGRMPTGQAISLAAFFIAAFALFWLRTPVESWLGTGPMKAQGETELRLVRRTAYTIAATSLAALAIVFWGGRNLQLLSFGAAAGAAFVVQAFLRKSGRGTRVASEIAGAAGLTSMAAAAFYIATREISPLAFVLWATNFAFAVNQIQFVQLRIRAARPMRPADKLHVGRRFFVEQILLVGVLTASCVTGRLPWTAAAAFLPVLYRGFAWFARKPEPLKIHALGWSEMRHAAAFGALLAAGFFRGG